jgi:hypothetical protein
MRDFVSEALAHRRRAYHNVLSLPFGPLACTWVVVAKKGSWRCSNAVLRGTCSSGVDHRRPRWEEIRCLRNECADQVPEDSIETSSESSSTGAVSSFL